MLDIYMEIDGRRVPPDQVGNALEQAVYKEAERMVRAKLSSVRCPEHDQAPEVILKGRAGSDLRFDIKGCCQTLIDTSIEKMK